MTEGTPQPGGAGRTNHASPPGQAAVLDPPAVAQRVFGDRIGLAVRYAAWLAGAGAERGLIGPHETDRLWDRHLLNCVAAGALIPPGSHVIDVGSGAGLPGIVLAIARPDLRIMLVEPMLRRTAFLEAVVDDLGLAAVEVRRARAEELTGLTRLPARADVVTARAVAPIDRLGAISGPLLRRGGQLLAIKGAGVKAEIAAGWAGLRRAAMTDRVALFTLLAMPLPVPAPSADAPWLPCVEAVCTSSWEADGTSFGAEPGGLNAGGELPLAVVLRAHRNA
jgi:16S rRNA (guanine527-N7)-methyltransferase